MLYRRLENATCLFLLAKNARPLLGMQCHPQCPNYAQGTGLSLFLPSFLGRFWPIFQINRHNAIHTATEMIGHRLQDFDVLAMPMDVLCNNS